MGFIRRAIQAVVANNDRIVRVAQLAALLWIGYELHHLAQNVYGGPSQYSEDVQALQEIIQALDRLTRTLALK